jgi:putative metallohydrolase (TIGR04338 family)
MSRLAYQTYLIKHTRKQNKGAEYTRDSERLKTYRAEWAFGSANGQGKEFSTIEEVQKFVEKVCKSKTWAKLWEENDRWEKWRKVVPVNQKMTGHGRRTAAFTNGESITVDPLCGMNEYTMLHELTHCLGHMHHGRSFRRDLLKLVSRFMGRDAATALKGEFKKAKLPCGEPRKPLTYEQWMAARIRMEKIRG